MKLADWARKEGIDYKTAYRLFKTNQFPHPTIQLKTGTILVHEPSTLETNTNVALYARVSSHDQEKDLIRQLERLRDYAAKNGLKITEEVLEIGSGLNGRRKKLLKLLSDPKIGIIIVEHRDRLARFGSDYIIASMSASKRQVIIINTSECKDDLVTDMVDVLTSFCARLYGSRGAKNRANKALEATKIEN